MAIIDRFDTSVIARRVYAIIADGVHPQAINK